MSLPAPAYSEARLRASYHVQIEVVKRGEIDTTPAHLGVSGQVRQVFRGDDLHLGDIVGFSVAVVREAEVNSIPDAGWLWMDYSDFQRATYFEAFLDGEPPYCNVARDQVFAIEHLSERPQFPAPTKREVKSEWAERKRKALRSSPIKPYWLAWLVHNYIKGKVLVNKFVKGW